jgi:hypothetical protein
MKKRPRPVFCFFCHILGWFWPTYQQFNEYIKG